MKIVSLTDKEGGVEIKEITGNVNFMRPDGSNTGNGVGCVVNSTTGEMMFFEILGMSSLGGIPSVRICGEEKYKRLMIRRCYPVLNSEELSNLGCAKWALENQLKIKEGKWDFQKNK